MNGFLFIFINHFRLHPTLALDYYSITTPGNEKINTSGLKFRPEVRAFSNDILFQWRKIGSSLFKVSSMGLSLGTFRIHNRIITWRQVIKIDFPEYIFRNFKIRNSLPPKVAYGSSVLETILSSGLLYSQHFTTKNIKIITEKTNATLKINK